jgi:PIN domain nuclease of toxin-antitoxin system
MRLLLDTVTFLDSALSTSDLSAKARDLIRDAENELFVSIVSLWEITIKHSLGKLELPAAPDRFIPENQIKLGVDLLPLDSESVFQLSRLPPLHRDPFDRALICQAIVHGMVILTPDERIARYPLRVAW